MDHVAFLRAVNVGGRKILMADLQALFVKLGFEECKTLLNSGNILFKGDGRKGAELEAIFEAATEKRFRLVSTYLVRTRKEIQRAVESNPFPKEAAQNPSRFIVMFLKTAPKRAAVDALRAALKGPEIVEVVGKQAYIIYPAGIGTSKLGVAQIDRYLGAGGTGRNWNTVLKTQALLAGAG
jgi:uncharacterized protein (DUF1697 family)